MSTKQTREIVPEKKGQSNTRPSTGSRIVYEEPHIFHVKSEQSLAHLRESRQYLPCVACTQEKYRRRSSLRRPHSSNVVRQPVRTNSFESRLSIDMKKKPRLPPTQADLERLSRPKSIPPKPISDNWNWNNFIHKNSKYGMMWIFVQN